MLGDGNSPFGGAKLLHFGRRSSANDELWSYSRLKRRVKPGRTGAPRASVSNPSFGQFPMMAKELRRPLHAFRYNETPLQLSIIRI